ncbi:hypothetical protein [Kaarinaea lacus]
MSEELPIVKVMLQIFAGVLLAAVVLYSIKGYEQKIRLVITAVALVVAVLVYVLVAAWSGNPLFVAIEIVGLLLFLLLIGLGFRYSFWFIVMGWLLHVLWDLGWQPAQTAPYVPHWYAWMCVGFDVVMAVYMSVLLVRHQQE